MKVKTSELEGAALDWAVAKCEGEAVRIQRGCVRPALGQFMPDEDWYKPSEDWLQGGPIIEREEICISKAVVWCAVKYYIEDVREPTCGYGPTLLIAAMRCFVASRLGDEVEIPEELK